MTEQLPDPMADAYLENMPPDFQSTLGDFFAKLDITVDGRGNRKPRTPMTRTGQPPTLTTPTAEPGTPHTIRATPTEMQQLIHLLAQLHTTDPDTTD